MLNKIVSSSYKQLKLFRSFSYNTNGILSPAARFLIDTKHLDSKQIHGTGKGGRIMKYDVLDFLSSKISTIKSQKVVLHNEKKINENKTNVHHNFIKQNYEDIPLTQNQQLTSKQLNNIDISVPYETVQITINLDQLMKVSKNYKNKSLKDSLLNSISNSLYMNQNMIQSIYNKNLKDCFIYSKDIQKDSNNEFINIITHSSLKENVNTPFNTSIQSIFTFVNYNNNSLLNCSELLSNQHELGVFVFSGQENVVGYNKNIIDDPSSHKNKEHEFINTNINKEQKDNKDISSKNKITNSYKPILHTIGHFSFTYNLALLSEDNALSLLKSIQYCIENPGVY